MVIRAMKGVILLGMRIDCANINMKFKKWSVFDEEESSDRIKSSND